MFDTLDQLFAVVYAVDARTSTWLRAGCSSSMLTTGRLRGLDGAPPYLDEFDGNVVLMTVRWQLGDWLSLRGRGSSSIAAAMSTGCTTSLFYELAGAA